LVDFDGCDQQVFSAPCSFTILPNSLGLAGRRRQPVGPVAAGAAALLAFDPELLEPADQAAEDGAPSRLSRDRLTASR